MKKPCFVMYTKTATYTIVGEAPKQPGEVARVQISRDAMARMIRFKRWRDRQEKTQ